MLHIYGKCVYVQKDKLHVAQITHHDFAILSSNTMLVYYLAFECCDYICTFPSRQNLKHKDSVIT